MLSPPRTSLSGGAREGRQRRMFKRHNQLFTALRVLLDVLLVAAAFWGAYALRFGSPRTWPYPELPLPQETLAVGLLALIVWPLSLRAMGLYRPQRQKTPLDEVFGVFKATLVAGLLLVALTYFIREVRYSRATLALFTFLAFLGISLERVFFKEVLQALRRRGYNLRYVLVLGAGRLARQVLEQIDLHRQLGFRPVGCLSISRKRVGTSVAGVEVLGTLRDLRQVLQSRGVDQVLVALPSRSVHHLPRIMEVCADTTVDVKLVPDVYQYATLFGGLEEFGGLPIVNLQSSGVLGINALAKRTFDLVLSGLFLVLLSPLLLAIALLVKAGSRGPALYAQERVGLDGRPFRMLKFRTMRTDAETEGPRFARDGDPRVTRLGALLRRSSLDELPQLWNVLVGDMSLVGPRPERPVFIDQFRRRIPRYQLRHMVKSGMTGWAQIHGLRGNTSISKRVEYDLYYIEHWSLLLDLKILARTVAFGFLSRNAY
ncbi:MAG TPA: undecaprenyl-phosphate glucose phosphotransferase [Myxococcales bacterium]|nr:undecaprenyl-phosphate glucose phosphotransferase [Myxococcales bacterium]